jgi:hypothetical protein
MVDTNLISPLPGTTEIYRVGQENAAAALDRPRKGKEKVDVRSEARPPAVTSNGHAGPGGEKGGRLNVVG